MDAGKVLMDEPLHSNYTWKHFAAQDASPVVFANVIAFLYFYILSYFPEYWLSSDYYIRLYMIITFSNIYFFKLNSPKQFFPEDVLFIPCIYCFNHNGDIMFCYYQNWVDCFWPAEQTSYTESSSAVCSRPWCSTLYVSVEPPNWSYGNLW